MAIKVCILTIIGAGSMVFDRLLVRIRLILVFDVFVEEIVLRQSSENVILGYM